jgi:hypothetical protein
MVRANPFALRPNAGGDEMGAFEVYAAAVRLMPCTANLWGDTWQLACMEIFYR